MSFRMTLADPTPDAVHPIREGLAPLKELRREETADQVAIELRLQSSPTPVADGLAESRSPNAAHAPRLLRAGRFVCAGKRCGLQTLLIQQREFFP